MSKFFALHRVRGVSARASEALTKARVDERTSRPLSAKARQAGLNILEAYGARRFPSDEDVLVFLDAVEPDHADWLREQLREAEKIEREMQLEDLYFNEDSE
jgi:hypothetical protein